MTVLKVDIGLLKCWVHGGYLLLTCTPKMMKSLLVIYITTTNIHTISEKSCLSPGDAMHILNYCKIIVAHRMCSAVIEKHRMYSVDIMKHRPALTTVFKHLVITSGLDNQSSIWQILTKSVAFWIELYRNVINLPQKQTNIQVSSSKQISMETLFVGKSTEVILRCRGHVS